MRPPTREEKLEAARGVAATLKLKLALEGRLDGERQQLSEAILKGDVDDATRLWPTLIDRRRLRRLCGDDEEVLAYAEPLVSEFALLVRSGAQRRAMRPPRLVYDGLFGVKWSDEQYDALVASMKTAMPLVVNKIPTPIFQGKLGQFGGIRFHTLSNP